MRILHVVHGLSRGGLENGVVNLINRLPYPDFEQDVCCLERSGEMADRIQRPVQIFEMKSGAYDVRIPLRLAKLVRVTRPDVVHCRNWNTWPDTALASLMAGHHAKLVWSFHGFMNGDHFPWRRRIASRILSYATDRLLAVCRDSATRYAQHASIRPERFDVIYNGVDCERFKPVAEKTKLRNEICIPPDTLTILTVASLTPIKDHATLLNAMALVRPHKKQPLQFLFVGEGILRREIEAKIKELGLTTVVHLLGNKDRIPEYLAASDIFVLPSRLEGMSNAILEAMASSLPVVANNVGGNPELVEHGHTGFLCNPGAPENMASAIQRLVDSESLRSQMGASSRARAVEKFSIRIMVENYARYYRGIVDSP